MFVDPLAEKYLNKMPYHYVSNNPIMRIDPTGMEDGPGDEFTTKKDAIKDFGMEYNGMSIAYGTELSTLFYQYEKEDGSKAFSYITPHWGLNGGMAKSLTLEDLAEGAKKNNHKNATLVVSGHTHGGAQENTIVNGEDTYNPSFFNPHDFSVYLNENNKNGYGRNVDGVITSPNGAAYYFDSSEHQKLNLDGIIYYDNPKNSFGRPYLEGLPSDKALSKKSRYGNNSNYSDPSKLPLNFNPEFHKRLKGY